VATKARELAGFAHSNFAHAGHQHDVYRAGSGPAVVVIHEMPGIHPGVVAEFAILADRTSPVTTWLRALAREVHGNCGGPGVGAVGMCFSGSFALAMALEPAVLAPVLSQPALPAPLTARKRAALGLDDDPRQGART
jgi:dienelactone hydrolase